MIEWRIKFTVSFGLELSLIEAGASRTKSQQQQTNKLCGFPRYYLILTSPGRRYMSSFKKTMWFLRIFLARFYFEGRGFCNS
jgi:hypothetical protein